MLCMYNYVDKMYDVKILYTHNTAHVMILPLEIIIIIHYTIRLTYNTFNNHLLREGYALLKCFSLLLLHNKITLSIFYTIIKYIHRIKIITFTYYYTYMIAQYII